MVIRAALAMSAFAGLVDCGGDETVAAYGGAGQIWKLNEIDGQAYQAHATMTFNEPGEISGDAPCNRYFGEQSAPYPWFKVEQLGSTKRACPELEQEQTFFQALTEMSLSEVAGDTLILSNDAGREMVFGVSR